MADNNINNMNVSQERNSQQNKPSMPQDESAEKGGTTRVNPTLHKRGKRPLWLRALRGCCWVILSAITALIIICASVVWVMAPEQLTPIVQRVASKVIDADVSLKRAELTFWSSFPKLKVEIDGLNIVSRSLADLSPAQRAELPDDADSLLVVKHFSGGINLVDAVAGKFTFDNVLLDGPRLNIVQVNDSVSNFNILPTSESTDTTSSAMPEITFNHFAINDAMPLRYRALSDSIDVTVAIRTISIDGVDTPQYELAMDTRIETPLLRDIAYDTMQFSLDGSINWSAVEPSKFNIDNLKFKLDDDIDLTLSTSVDMSDKMTFNSLDIALRNIRPSSLAEHAPADLRNDLATLDTDMAIDLSARLLKPYVLTDSVTLPSIEAEMTVNDCRFALKTLNLKLFNADIKAEINGDDINKSVITVNNIRAKGRAMDFSLSAKATDLISDPHLKGEFNGLVNIGQLPDIVRNNIGAYLKGRFNADTKFDFRLSELSQRSFHKADIEGEVSLRDFRYVSADTLTNFYSGNATLTFGTAMKLDRNDAHIDSLLMVRMTVDSVYVWYDGIETRLKDLQAAFGASNVASSSDTTQINPFGGSVYLADLRCYSADDSMIVRLCDIGGGASLQRFRGDAKLPQLLLRLGAGRMLMAQPQYLAALKGAKMDVTAHIRPRRLRKLNQTSDSIATDSLNKSLRKRNNKRMTVGQLDSIGVDLMEFDVDNSLRSLMQRWKMHGTMQAERGIMRVSKRNIRNNFTDLDLTFSTDSVDLKNLDYQFGHSDLHVKGKISNIRKALSKRRPAPVKINFDINSDSININEIVRLLSVSAPVAEASEQDFTVLDDWAESDSIVTASADSMPDSITGPILVPVNIDAVLNINANKVIYSDLLLDNFAGRLLINRGMVNLSNLSAATEIGSLNVSGLYSAPTADKINFGMAMNLNNFHVARLPQVVPAIDSIMPMMQYLSGVVNAQIAVTSDITPDMYFDIPSLKAAMQFTGDSLVVFDNDTFRTLSKWLMFKDKKHNMIDKLNVEMTIADGILNLYPFMVNIDRYKLGVMGYNDLDFNLHYHIAVLKSPIPFKFGINIKGVPGDMKIRLGGAKFKEKFVAQRDSITTNTRISLMSEINNAFKRGIRAAGAGPLRIKGIPDSTFMKQPEEKFSAADSAVMIREGFIEVPDSLAADIFKRTNTVIQNDKSSK